MRVINQMRCKLILLAIAFIALTPFSLLAQTAESYEGFGAVTRGALDCPTGYETFRVTSLDNSGPGTLRDAISQGCRYIVFDVGGTITLTNALYLFYSYITIDGASAPDPGVTIVQTPGAATIIEAMPNKDGPISDIIIHHLRMDGQTTPGAANGDCDIWGIDGESASISRVVIDHVTAMSSDDGIFDITGEVSDVTLSWNIIMNTEVAQLLRPGKNERISLHHNIYALNNERQVKMRHHNDVIDYVNNVVYGWGWIEAGSSGLHIGPNIGVSNDEFPTLNVENSVFHYVEGLPGSNPNNAIQREIPGKIYFNGNIVPEGETDNYSTSERHVIPQYAEVTKHDASTLGDTVVPFAGTHYPTQEEQELLDEISSAIGGQGVENINYCASNPCQNNGTCQNIEDGYTCTCLDGFEGEDCEIDLNECPDGPDCNNNLNSNNEQTNANTDTSNTSETNNTNANLNKDVQKLSKLENTGCQSLNVKLLWFAVVLLWLVYRKCWGQRQCVF